jgi:nicotinate-nucleotide pyrophosphorylase (carboxylating)
MYGIKNIVRMALEEDIGPGDITTKCTIPSGMKVKAVLCAKEDCVICGLGIAEAVFKMLDDGVKFKSILKDGDHVNKGKIIAEIEGDARVILSGERTALNFMQRLSGIATKTKEMVESVNGAKVLDTRKTTPGLRLLEKYAVKCGGGENHRKGLYDEILIKDNHIKLVGLGNAVGRAKKTGKRIEVEVRNLREVSEALDSGADIIMLDNMPLETMKKAVRAIGGRAIVEVSGGVNKDNIGRISKLGVDWISVGSLTHSVKSVNIGLDIEKL